jgi:hypothetical protein
LVLALAIVPVTLSGCSSTPNTISTGTGTATVTWEPVSGSSTGFGNPPQPFTGTIDGLLLSGVATTPSASSASPLSNSGKIPSTIEFFRWKGTFAGKPFDVGFYATYHPATNLSNPVAMFSSTKITGTWGSQAVNGHIVTPTAAQLKSGKGPLRFDGTVGEYKVSGSIPQPTGTGDRTKRTGTATFTISE